VWSWLKGQVRSLQALALAPTLHALAVLQEQQAADYLQLEALGSLLAVVRPRAPFLPFRGWAVGPDFAVLLLREVLMRRQACVVELGSGVSTLVLGYAVERTGGRLVSVDHDASYAAHTEAEVARHGLQDSVTIVHAPLEPWAGGSARWYSRAWVEALPPIDVLVVDGPPGDTGPLARYPALPALATKLSPGAVLIADDAHRPDERAMVAQWLKEQPGLTANSVATEQGAVVLRWPAGGRLETLRASR
jgi:predicted O-methyltransferase YrrM